MSKIRLEDAPIRYKTNTEVLSEYMEFGSPMKQVFVIEACRVFAEHLIKNKAKYLKQSKHSWVSGQAMIQAAEDWQKASEQIGKGVPDLRGEADYE